MKFQQLAIRVKFILLVTMGFVVRSSALYSVPYGITALPDFNNVPASEKSILVEFTLITSIPDDAFTNTSHVERLDIINNVLTDIQTNAFRGLPFLKRLDLTNNSLTSFPNLIPLGPSLERAILSENNLTTIPSVKFSNMTALTNLILSFNDILPVTIPIISTGAPNLSLLQLGNNKLKSMTADDLAGFNKLEILKTMRSGLKSIPKLPLMPTLKTWIMSNNVIKNISNNAFEDVVNLTNLHIDNNKIIKAPNVTTCKATLRFLDLSNNPLNSLKAEYFVGPFFDIEAHLRGDIKSGVFLRTLNVTNSSITEFNDKLLSVLENLRYLNASNCNISTFPNLTIRGDVLKNVVLGQNNISEIPSESLLNMTKLEKLDLYYNAIENFPFLMLNSSPNLMILNLAENNVSSLPDLRLYTKEHMNLTIDITGNPLMCDNRFCWLKQMSQGNVSVLLSAQPCHSPAELVNKDWINVSMDDLNCNGDPHIHNHYKWTTDKFVSSSGDSSYNSISLRKSSSNLHCARTCSEENSSRSYNCIGFQYDPNLISSNCELYIRN